MSRLVWRIDGAVLPSAQQGAPADNSSGGKITIMTASDEVGLRHAGHLGQPRNLRENVLAGI